MEDLKLTEREGIVLKTLILTYLETARPVGSRTLSKTIIPKLSPATIRNNLADLDEKGLLKKPHTSAGRIPTIEGYRYYVNNLLSPKGLDQSERNTILRVIKAEYEDMFEFLDAVSQTLSSLSHQLGIIIPPLGENLRLYRLDVIPVSAERIHLVISTTGGKVRSVILNLPSPLEMHTLFSTCAILNERLSGLSLAEIRSTIRRRLGDIYSLKNSFLSSVLDRADSIFHFDPKKNIHYHGTMELLNQPEFHETNKMRALFSLLETRSDLSNYLSLACPPQGIKIRIGGVDEGFSFVSCQFESKYGDGIVGLIGPLRMDYGKAMSIISFSGDYLSRILRCEMLNNGG